MTMNVQLERARTVVANLPPLAPRPLVDFRDLVSVLQEPSALFGEPSALKTVDETGGASLDSDSLVDLLSEVVGCHGLTCSAIMEVLQVAAQMARDRALSICSGNTFQFWVYGAESDDLRLRYILRLDAPASVAAELDDDLLSRLIDLDICRTGFVFSFAGEWTDDEVHRLKAPFDDSGVSKEGSDAGVLS